MASSELVALLESTLSPVKETRTSAVKTLKQLSSQQGFAIRLLTVLEASGLSPGLQQSAGIYFKNLIKETWAEVSLRLFFFSFFSDLTRMMLMKKTCFGKENAAGVLSQADREAIKQHLLTLMCQVDRKPQVQLSEAIRIIALSDFPDKWRTLLPELRTKLGATQDFKVIVGLLETANSIFKMFRDQPASDPLWLKVKYSLEEFQAPLLLFMKQCMDSLDKAGNDKVMLEKLLTAIRLLCRIFFSLSWQDIPEYFEDHMEEWTSQFHVLLNYDNKIMDTEDDDIPGKIEVVQTAVMDVLALFVEKYEEQFVNHIQGFAVDTWNLLNRTPTLPKYDDLVVISLRFLGALVSNFRQKHLFKQQGTLDEIIKKIVVPNVQMRESDYEDFEDNPMEYIRRDIEGSDSDTRRRLACDLIRSMCKYFEEDTTKLCQGTIGILINDFKANPDQNWRNMDTAINMMLALSIRKYMHLVGVTEVNSNVNVHEFFTSIVMPELNRDINAQPVVKADVIKFFSSFRKQLPREMIVTTLPRLVELLKARSFVVHTYAAQAIERIFMVKEEADATGMQKRFVYGAAELNPILAPCMMNLFAILETEEEGVANEYVAKTVMRVITKAKPENIATATEGVLGKLKTTLDRVCANPQNPRFIHYLFESIAALIRATCSVNPAFAEQFEASLMPAFQSVLQSEIAELTPYVFQILAQLLELRTSTISQGYISLFQPLLHPDVWSNKGNHPALIRLLEAYLRKAAKETIGTSAAQLQGLLGVFQMLLSLKSTADSSFRILIGIVEFLPPDSYENYFQEIFNLIVTRLGQLSTKSFALSMTTFLSVLIGKHGVRDVVKAMDNVPNTNGFGFKDYVERFWVPAVGSIKTDVDRKACAIALTRIILENDELKQSSRGSGTWSNCFVAILSIFTVPVPMAVDPQSQEEELAAISEIGYSSSFSKLTYAQTEVRDYFKEIPQPRNFFLESLAKASQQTPGVYPQLIQTALDGKPVYKEHFHKWCRETGISIQ